MPKATKIYSKLVLAVKIATVIAFVWIVFSQRKSIQNINFQSIKDFKISLFLAVIALAPLNWYFEYLKWKATLKSLNHYAFQTSVESFLSGITSGFITPNFIGNFVGRVFYYPFKIRPKIILFTLLANFSQFLTTVTIGAFALILLPIENSFFPANYNWIVYLFVCLGWLIFFFFEKLNLDKINFLSFIKHLKLAQPILILKLQFIYYNTLRYIVFSIQYLLMLNVFSIDFDIKLYGYITLIYFWSTLIPNFIWGKLFLRETVALVILVPLISNTNVILIASILLSTINQIIPAMIGIPYLIKKKKYE